MDRRHGKRPLPFDESEEKSEQQQSSDDLQYNDNNMFFPVYSARSQQDMSAMVSALSQVIGNTSDHHLPVHPNLLPSTDHDQPIQSHSVTDQQQQGIIYIYI